jgi:hypothetical protein
MKQRIIEKKKEEMQGYMGQVKTLLAKYTPPDPQKMEEAFKSGNASLNPNEAAQTVGLVFKTMPRRTIRRRSLSTLQPRKSVR